jgi:guanylate kinase
VDNKVEALIFLIIGPTGVGKNTLINGIFEKRKNLYYLPSFTTREIRAGEKDGEPYKFVSKEEFESMIEKGEFIEWNIVQGSNYYGVNKSYIQEELNKKHSVITDIDVLGAIDIIEHFPRQTVGIFITLSNREDLDRRVRNRNRGESEKEISKRLERAKMEFYFKRHFDYIIVNDVVKDAVTELSTIIDFELENMKTREIYENADFLHYYVKFFLSCNDYVLMMQKKGEPNPNKWILPGRHILRNETPNKALYRLLKRGITNFDEKYPGITDWAKIPAMPISSKHLEVNNTHWHYEMNFRYAVDKMKDLESTNYNYQWKSLSYFETMRYL